MHIDYNQLTVSELSVIGKYFDMHCDGDSHCVVVDCVSWWGKK